MPARRAGGDTSSWSLLALRRQVLDWAFAFPDQQCQWYAPAVRSLSRLPREQRPDVVFATGGPWTGLLVGQRLAELFDVPFVADFRDPWTMNPLDTTHLAPWLARRARSLERRVVAAAARIVLNTDELRRRFCSTYPDAEQKCLTITNGFDDDVLVAATATYASGDAPITAPEAPRLELAHFGSLYGGRNPEPLLRASTELLREGRIRVGDLRLRFVGTWEVPGEACELLARGLERIGVLRRDPSMSREQCLAEMSRSQNLLALQGEFTLQIPGKVYEYVATGRPILIIGGEGATAELIEGERLGACWPNVVAALKERIAGLIEQHVTIEAPGLAKVERFHYRHLTGRLAEVLSAVVTEGQRS